MRGFVVGLLLLADAQPPPIYWASAPRGNGTALWAGSFGEAPTAFVCFDASCASPQPLPTLLAHELSIAAVLPPACGSASPPCTFSLCASPGACATVPDPRAADVWWATSAGAAAPLPGASFYPGPSGDGFVQVFPFDALGGSLLRVFGRHLGGACLPSGGAPLLRLGGGHPDLAAASASCFEATFDLAGLPALVGGAVFPGAALMTPFSDRGAPLPLRVAAPPPPAPLTVFRVDDPRFGGNVSAALAAAAAVAGDKVVLLGARAYSCAMELLVPPNTVLVGAGAGASSLAFDLAASTAPARTPAILGAGSHWALRGFSLVLLSARAYIPAVKMAAGTTNFSVTGLRVSLQQNNVSNAFAIYGGGWSITDSEIEQGGVCLWPPQSDTTDFPDSVTLRLFNATDGVFARNILRWRCSAFDMDVSSRIAFEHNQVTCTVQGVIPHGNSVSSYSWGEVPFAQNVFYASNVQTRPPHNNATDWAFHETWTTDGPGGWGGGVVTGIDGSTVAVASGLSTYLAAAGATATVVSGPGTGQFRRVAARDNATSVTLAAPFDGAVRVGASIISVTATVGGKHVVNNTFVWGSVVQQFGVGLGGVFADNRFTDQNNAGADSGAVDGSLTGFGLCYGKQPQSMFFFEYENNTMASSNGISLHDVTGNAQCNATFMGPFIKWATLRHNTVGGVAPSNPGVCGSLNATNPQTSDLLVEGNDVARGCPPGNALPCGDGVCIYAAHSVILP